MRFRLPSGKGRSAPAIALARSASFVERVRESLAMLVADPNGDLGIGAILRNAKVNRSTLYTRRKDTHRSYVHQDLIDEIDLAIKARQETAKGTKIRRRAVKEERQDKAPEIAILVNELIMFRTANEVERKRCSNAERSARDALLSAYTYAIALRRCWRIAAAVPTSISDFILRAESELRAGDPVELADAARAGEALAGMTRLRPASVESRPPMNSGVTPIRRPGG